MAISGDNDRIVIVVTKEMKNQLTLLSKNDGRSLSNYVQKVLKSHLDEQQKD